jgi:SAM-dependent methyltransferase
MEPPEYDQIASLEERHWWYAGMRASARALLRAGLARARPGPDARPLEILDAGSGAGGGLRWLAEFGRVTGLDFHPKAVRLTRRFSERVTQASVLAVPFAGGTFDVVTSFDVLYHRAVPDDGLALRELARVLRPGGWLLVRVPAHDRLRGAHDVQVHTRHRYARDELRAKLMVAGLAPCRVTFAGALLLVPALLRRGLQRGAVAAAQAHSDVVMPPPLINALLGAGLRWERWWLRRWDLPAGLSLMALAQKEA